ncbi:MAG: hypothetical protein II936_03970 [Oscillospiraceae bacterium]|nr:hypothetical protein [Oscillospiraceae bacterium]
MERNDNAKKLSEIFGISLDEAISALDASNGDELTAAEHIRSRIASGGMGASFSTNSPDVVKGQDTGQENLRDFLKSLWKGIIRTLERMAKTNFVVNRGGKEIGLPLIAVLIASLLIHKYLIIVIIVLLILRCDMRFEDAG